MDLARPREHRQYLIPHHAHVVPVACLANRLHCTPRDLQRRAWGYCLRAVLPQPRSAHVFSTTCLATARGQCPVRQLSCPRSVHVVPAFCRATARVNVHFSNAYGDGVSTFSCCARRDGLRREVGQRFGSRVGLGRLWFLPLLLMLARTARRGHTRVSIGGGGRGRGDGCNW